MLVIMQLYPAAENKSVRAFSMLGQTRIERFLEARVNISASPLLTVKTHQSVLSRGRIFLRVYCPVLATEEGHGLYWEVDNTSPAKLGHRLAHGNHMCCNESV